MKAPGVNHDSAALASLALLSHTMRLSCAFANAMFAIYGAGAETVYYGFLLLLARLSVYVLVAAAARGGRLASPGSA